MITVKVADAVALSPDAPLLVARCEQPGRHGARGLNSGRQRQHRNDGDGTARGQHNGSTARRWEYNSKAMAMQETELSASDNSARPWVEYVTHFRQ